MLDFINKYINISDHESKTAKGQENYQSNLVNMHRDVLNKNV